MPRLSLQAIARSWKKLSAILVHTEAASKNAVNAAHACNRNLNVDGPTSVHDTFVRARVRLGDFFNNPKSDELALGLGRPANAAFHGDDATPRSCNSTTVMDKRHHGEVFVNAERVQA